MIENKKIVYLVTQSKYGGAQKYVLQLAYYFSQKNEVTVLVGEAKNQDQQFFDKAKELGIKVKVLKRLERGIDPVGNIASIFEIRKQLRNLAPDILHINSSMAGFVGSLAAFLYNMDPLHVTLKVIYTAHGFVFNEPLSSIEKKVYTFLEKISSSWKAKIITVSNYDYQSGIDNGIAKTKLTTIHNGINEKEYTFLDRGQARQGLDLGDEKVIGTVASLYPTKNIPLLLKAARKINETFVIIGDGPERNAIEKQIKDFKLSNVKLVGSKNNAYQYLKAFDIFVLPSVKEGLPYTLLEAGLAELPVIATNVGGCPEVIEDQKTGLIIPSKNEDELIQSIAKLLKDNNLATNLAKNLKSKVTKEYSAEKMLFETSSIYNNVVGS